jgi:acyl-CoA synthetase (NDP forming)
MAQNKSDIGFFFNPKSIAVVGASPTAGKLSYVILENLKKIGFPGSIYPVNPKYTSINEMRCYSSIEEIGSDIDIAVIALPAPLVSKTLNDIGKRVMGVIIIGSGFKEIGNEGKRLEEEIKEISEKNGIRVMGPNCLGIYDTVSKVDTFFIRSDRIERPRKGGISIISQSGSFAGTIMDELAYEGIGVSRVINYGNRVDVNESDCLEFLADDESTKVVALYIESVDDGRRFIDAASRCIRKKTVIAVKVGRRDMGANAARSHTGAMTGWYEIYKTAFKKAGIIEVDGYEEFKDACRTLNTYSSVKGKRVLIITDGGGIGVRIADECDNSGLDVSGLSEEIKNSLSAKLPPFCFIGNPIDLTGSVTDKDYITALEEGLRDRFDIIIMAVLWGPPQLTVGLVDKLIEFKSKYKIPIIVCSPGGEFTKNMNRLFEEKGIPVFSTPESAVRAASILCKKYEQTKDR